LKSFSALFSLIGHVIIILAAQVTAFEVVRTLPCDKSAVADEATGNSTRNISNGDVAENGMTINAGIGTGCEPYATFTVGSLQIVFLSFIFAKGPPFRMPFYTNCKGNLPLRNPTATIFYLIVTFL
jgi:hypothetical protein